MTTVHEGGAQRVPEQPVVAFVLAPELEVADDDVPLTIKKPCKVALLAGRELV